MDDDLQYQQWWERVFKEREDALDTFFGPSHPPGAPEGYVTSFHACGTEDHRVLIPGACAHVYPPCSNPSMLSRKNWLYATVGLSQPHDMDEEPWDDETRGRQLSGHGLEFAILLPAPGYWAPDLLAVLMGYSAAQAPLYEGHRLAGGFHKTPKGNISWFLGTPGPDLPPPCDDTRAFLFWPLIGARRWFTTSTGNFELLCATNITADEWDYAKKTSSAHLMLLLAHAGIGQQSLVARPTVLSDPTIRRLAEQVRSDSRDRVSEALALFDPTSWL